MLGKPQPYSKSFGNILNYMIRSLTITLSSATGLFCSDGTNCEYNLGGLFVTTSVNSLLFSGFSDPFTLKYLDLKHRRDNISFSCVTTPYLPCGGKNYDCSDSGVRITTWTRTIDLVNENPSIDIFFRPFFYIDSAGNLTLTTDDSHVQVMNPFWSAYSAENIMDEEFLKTYNCLGAIYFGHENEFRSCTSTVNSGASESSQLANMRAFKGNSSIDQVASLVAVEGTSDLHAQEAPLLWDAFRKYPYPYYFSYYGRKYHSIPAPSIFDDSNTLRLQYSQTQLLSITQEILYDPALIFSNLSSEGSTYLQRFTEDPNGWTQSAEVEGVPLDSYGMPYKVPIGMVSLGHLAGFPLFIGTPENYGIYEAVLPQ